MKGAVGSPDRNQARPSCREPTPACAACKRWAISFHLRLVPSKETPVIQETPLWQRLYGRPEYYELARKVGYKGCTYHQLTKHIDELAKTYDKQKLESASYYLFTFDGQMTVNPKPMAEVKLRENVRRLCWQLLGPPPGHPVSKSGRDMVGEQPKPDPQPAPPPSPPKEKPKLPSTPVMEQWQAAKEQHPGMIVLFRIGDFYESFGEDAEFIAKELGLTVTTRDKTFPMAGFPLHALESHLQKLLKAGHRVAIAEQVQGKRDKKRRVTRVVTPASLVDEPPKEESKPAGKDTQKGASRKKTKA